MKINWYGKGCFFVENDQAKILIDPYDNKLKQHINDEIDVVLLPVEGVEFDHHLVFDWPGEYESKGVGIKSLDARNSKDEEINVFILEMEKIRICHLGPLDRALTTDELTILGDVDILFLPVGGAGVMDAKTAHKVAEDVDPRMIVPMYYSFGDDKDGYAPIDTFKQEMGLKEDLEVQKSLSVKSLLEDQTQIVLLERG